MGSGLFPAIKTALVDVCHEFKSCNVTILKGYGELGLGRPRQDGFHSDFEINFAPSFSPHSSAGCAGVRPRGTF